MRTTLNIADDLLHESKKISAACDRSLTQAASEVLRLGLQRGPGLPAAGARAGNFWVHPASI